MIVWVDLNPENNITKCHTGIQPGPPLLLHWVMHFAYCLHILRPPGLFLHWVHTFCGPPLKLLHWANILWSVIPILLLGTAVCDAWDCSCDKLHAILVVSVYVCVCVFVGVCFCICVTYVRLCASLLWDLPLIRFLFLFCVCLCVYLFLQANGRSWDIPLILCCSVCVAKLQSRVCYRMVALFGLL